MMWNADPTSSHRSAPPQAMTRRDEHDAEHVNRYFRVLDPIQPGLALVTVVAERLAIRQSSATSRRPRDDMISVPIAPQQSAAAMAVAVFTLREPELLPRVERSLRVPLRMIEGRIGVQVGWDQQRDQADHRA